MSEENESVVRAAYEAYGRSDVNRLLEMVHPDLEWTYLDPSAEDPQPQVCHGQQELAQALGQQADRGLVSQVEEIASSGDKVMVAVHTPGADQRRAWQSGDRSYLVLTMDRGRIVALRDFRERDEARSFTGLGEKQ
jgi:ketosteroid isomerase-like protein